jgi:hypothetical protein
MSDVSLHDLSEDWAAVKLPLCDTGLSRAVWITENQGYQHDVRVKVSPLLGGGGTWLDAIFVSGRPPCKEIVPRGRRPRLSSADLDPICRWIALNRNVILDFWNGALSAREALAKLQKLP